MRKLLTRILPLATLLAVTFLALPTIVRADSPAVELANLARRVNTALVRLDAHDVKGARAEFKAFDAGWFDIEDGIRTESKASYRSIEDAMGDARFALEIEPLNADKARAALLRLRSECDAFIAGRYLVSEKPSASTQEVTLPSIATHIDKALARLDGNDAAGAAAEVSAFRRGWVEVEGLVNAKSTQVYTSTENNMAQAYALLVQRPPDIAGARDTLAQMKTDLAPFAGGEMHYGMFDAAIILLREGLEALLVLGALLAFLRKTRNADRGRWIWAGGGMGVVASVVVAVVVNLAFSRASAGVNRELLEGFTGLVAAGMLIYMSVWLHSKANLGAWQRYINDKTTSALARNSLISLALIAFLAVFREGAETILFYVGIAPAIATSDLGLGLGIGAAGLALIGALILVFGVRLPIRPFFLGTSVLVFYLAFKFIGSGIHSLQVAGRLQATPVDYLPASGWLGLFPTWETTLVQAALVLAALSFVLVTRLQRVGRPPGRPPGSTVHQPTPG